MTKMPDIEILAAVIQYGSERAAARALGIARTTFQDWHHVAQAGAYTARTMVAPEAVEPGEDTRYWILSSAQDGTEVDEAFLENLEAYAEFLDAEILISGFTYNKALFEDHSKYKASYHQRVRPYLYNRRLEIGGSLVFCGEMNTLPTAVDPLSGFETYTQHRSGVFPHAKVHLVSVPMMKSDPAKILMTTGAVTKSNYVQKRAGLRAEFHHTLGAVLVELTPDGEFFCRHLLADTDGSFYDLTRFVSDGEVREGHRVTSIVWGDIHHEQLDPVVAKASFGLPATGKKKKRGDSMLDVLKPQFQVIHDLSDFRARSHHNISDPHFRFKSHVHGVDNVEQAINSCAQFLSDISRDWIHTYVAESNHDLALIKWLRTADYRTDPENALFFLHTQARVYQALKDGEDISILQWAIDRTGISLPGTTFLREEDSLELSGIEYAMHGHLGSNGARPAPKQFTKSGPKATTGHTHSAGIIDGIYTVGTSSKLDMGYNKGLSSWSHSHVVAYASGKRAVITMKAGRWHG